MKVYFLPLACSMAARIAVYEAGVSATFVEVDSLTKRTHDGEDYTTISPLCLVPTLRTDAGEVLMENAAILQHVAELSPEAGLMPKDARGRALAQQWLSFVSTELHKGIFSLVFDRKAPEHVKAYVLEKGLSRFAFLDQYLTGREFLLDQFSVADAYLVTVLNWCAATPLKLSQWPALAAYHARLRKRPSVARAIAEEHPLYMAEQERRRAAG